MGGRGASININFGLKKFQAVKKIKVLAKRKETVNQENVSNKESRNKYFREEKFRKIAKIPKPIEKAYFLNEKIKIENVVMQPDSVKQHVLGGQPNISGNFF